MRYGSTHASERHSTHPNAVFWFDLDHTLLDNDAVVRKYGAYPLPLVEALLLGTLIAPTDPIAVLGILRAANAPKALETVMAAESLLNDGSVSCSS